MDCVNGHRKEHTKETRWLWTSDSSTSCWWTTRSQKTSWGKRHAEAVGQSPAGAGHASRDNRAPRLGEARPGRPPQRQLAQRHDDQDPEGRFRGGTAGAAARSQRQLRTEDCQPGADALDGLGRQNHFDIRAGHAHAPDPGASGRDLQSGGGQELAEPAVRRGVPDGVAGRFDGEDSRSWPRPQPGDLGGPWRQHVGQQRSLRATEGIPGGG